MLGTKSGKPGTIIHGERSSKALTRGQMPLRGVQAAKDPAESGKKISA